MDTSTNAALVLGVALLVTTPTHILLIVVATMRRAAIWPAVALFGFNMLGDALRALLDPRLKGG